MAIEFRCSSCQQLLRVPDTSAGQQAKCPSCSTVQTIPAASQAAPTAAPSPAPAYRPDAANPYSAPQPIGGPGYMADQLDPLERSGPPWERDGKSFASWWETTKLVLTEPTKMFSTMRRTGGLSAPIMHAVPAGTAAAVVASLLQSMGMTVIGANDAQGAAAIGGAGIGLLCTLILAPFMVALGILINAAIVHVCLMVVGGAKQPFEATARVGSYVSGALNVVSWIPVLNFALIFVYPVYMILGIMNVHEISGGKATFAVLLPLITCCGLSFVMFAMIFMVGISAQH